jgi:ubiquinone/menaquinone biosynthesis C-methylase UbiE
MAEKTRNQIESDRGDWDALAEGWYRTHHWTRFKTELEALAGRWKGGRLLNIGCGHGADFLPFNPAFQSVGLDFSREMLVQANRYGTKFKRRFELVKGDAAELPFQDDIFESVIAVAVVHHLRMPERRALAFSEIRRVLKPGGEAFITVWNRGQPRFWFAGREAIVAWRLRDGPVKRYHYLYTYRSLSRALKSAGLEIVSLRPESAWKRWPAFFSRNICVLVRKKDDNPAAS